MDEYRLSGPQVEPEASFWGFCANHFPCPLTIDELLPVTDDPDNPHFFPPYPTNPDVIRDEFEELRELQRLRNDPFRVTSTQENRERLPISQFLQLRPPPLRGGGQINMARQDSFPVLFTGGELARYFENNTPGLGHRQALNFLIQDTGWSPPRQALAWAVLDATIYSALLAAWYYKWLSPRENVSRRQRPIEYAIDNGFADTDGNDLDDQFTVLFDRTINSTGSDSNGLRPNFPTVSGFISSSPGTPRHPAYPSGHSTYAGAASELLSFFFPDYRRELDFLADNTGIARLWAGIHWRSDHEAGMKLGRTVACLMIDKLRRTGIPLVPAERPMTETPPPIEELNEKAAQFKDECGQVLRAAPDFRQPMSTPCVPPGDPGTDTNVRPADIMGQSFVG